MRVADELISVRDLLRYAVSRFNTANLTYGHGTANALDEAAFLILEGLRLPVDDINPWLDARLTLGEREKLVGLFDARIETRKPAPYLVGKAYIQGIPFRVDERVIIPRSFIAELLLHGELGPDRLGLIDDPSEVGSVLDLCTGSGCLAILAAMCFPHARIDAVDLSPDALGVARLNVDDHGVGEHVELLEGSLFAPLAGRRYDLIITNPPYVAAGEVEAFPAEYASEPQMAHLGGEDGLDLVREIIAQAGQHLTPGGGMICEIGTGRHFLEQEYPDLPFVWLDTEDSEGEVFWLGADSLQQFRND
ncbi:50S ribosomal protein L3 N(5)-glutamine methyltransferase [Devosia sp. ZB163]|nr:50S ribosomal protein L3 N(5)-glutamine methyltransferase [Devosia sp. ZB163]MDC9825412.1 50S ribosomal protein L3 N(5)-glutamine methyltransferase [Devosia sp. ZB163]